MGFEKQQLEKLAEAAHEVFCDGLRAKGYRYGPVTRDRDKEHSSLKPYSKLAEEEKQQNRNNVQDIPRKLASIGYAMRLCYRNEPTAEFSKDEVENLAKMEHDRWMQQKLAATARRGKTIDQAKTRHKDLVPWDQLSQGGQDKDRALVKGIPRILAKAGYTVVKRSK